MTYLGQAIKSIRKAKHITQEDLAELIQVSLKTVQNYEKDKVDPPFSKVKDIADALGVRLSAFDTPSAATIELTEVEVHTRPSTPQKLASDLLNVPHNPKDQTDPRIPLIRLENTDLMWKEIENYIVIPDLNVHPQEKFFIRMTGEATVARFKAGDIVAGKLVPVEGFCIWGAPCIIKTASYGVLYRRIRKSEKEGYFRLTTDDNHERFAEIEIPIKEIELVAIIIGGIIFL